MSVQGKRVASVRTGIWVEVFTVVWMAVEVSLRQATACDSSGEWGVTWGRG